MNEWELLGGGVQWIGCCRAILSLAVFAAALAVIEWRISEWRK